MTPPPAPETKAPTKWAVTLNRKTRKIEALPSNNVSALTHEIIEDELECEAAALLHAALFEDVQAALNRAEHTLLAINRNARERAAKADAAASLSRLLNVLASKEGQDHAA